MIFVDERTTRDTRFLVVAEDRGMSGWGASQGRSVCAWATDILGLDAVKGWVEARCDMQNVRVIDDHDRKYRPEGADHFHIYLPGEGHPAFCLYHSERR